MKKAWLCGLLALILMLSCLVSAEEGCVVEAEEEAAVEAVDEAVTEAVDVALELPREEVAGQSDEYETDIVAEAAEGAGVAPNAVAIDLSQGSVFYLGMPVQLTAVLDPGDAQTTLKWKSSKKKVAKVSADGLLPPLRAGKTRITVTTGNKKKASANVKIARNLIDNLTHKPTAADIKELGGGWKVTLRSVERTASGKYVCNFYLLNGAGKSRQINNFGVELFVGGKLVARKVLPKIKVACGKGKSVLFKVTFGNADILNADAMLLPQFKKAEVNFLLTTEPTLSCKGATVPIYSIDKTLPDDLPRGVQNDETLADQLFNLVNELRASQGLYLLKKDAELTRAACVRAGEIAVKFSHTRPDGTSCTTVSPKVGGENISAIGSDAQTVLDAWMTHDGHRLKIISAKYHYIGICAYRTEDRGIYWVQEFGR